MSDERDERDERDNNDYPSREKAVIDTGSIETPETTPVETPERPVIDGLIRPDSIPAELWDTFTVQQKKAQIATIKANKIHAEKHGG